MAEEASLLIVARMRDEASGSMASLGQTTQKTSMDMQQMQMTLMATGSALAAVGSLMNQMESPQVKMAAQFFVIAGAIMSTTGAIMTAMPQIAKLTASLRSLAIVQSVIAALSGPGGWAMLGVGAAVGIGAGIGISKMTASGGGGGNTVINNIGGSMITEREVGEITRRSIIKNADQNSSSGVR